MAATIAIATGYDTSRTKEASRLGSVGATARANTWTTFTTASINRDGSGYVEVVRHGEVIHRFAFDPE